MDTGRNMAGTALLALAAAFGVAAVRAPSTLAANVQPARAEDYAFTRPLATNRIRGVVMGRRPDYCTPRGEDFDWLAEAVAERQAILSGEWPDSIRTVARFEFGKWELSRTNGAPGWIIGTVREGRAATTNVVVLGHSVTSSVPFSAREKWETLHGRTSGISHRWDAGLPLLSEPFGWAEGGGFPPQETNVFRQPYREATPTSRVHRLEVAFSNGQQRVVLSNTVFFTALAPAERTVTNVWEYGGPMDDFLAGNWRQGGTNSFNRPRIDTELPPLRLSTPYVLSNVYDSLAVPLRGHAGLGTGAADTNAAPLVWDWRYGSSLDPDAERHEVYTNRAGYSDVEISASHHFYTNYVNVTDDEGRCLYTNRVNGAEAYYWSSPGSDWIAVLEAVPVDSRSGWTFIQRPARTVFSNVCDYALVETNGVRRLEPEALFCVASVYFHSLPDGGADAFTFTNNFTAVLPMAAPQLADFGGKAGFALRVDKFEIFAAACAAAGVPAPSRTPGSGAPGFGLYTWRLRGLAWHLFWRGHPVTVPPEDETEEQQKE